MINTYFQNKKKTMTLKLLDATGYPCRLTKSAGKNLKEYKVYGNSEQNGTPTPTEPIEVLSLGETSRNLFDKNASQSPMNIGADGTVYTNNPLFAVSNFIPVENKTYNFSYIYTLNALSYIRVHFYNYSKEWVSQLYFQGDTIIGNKSFSFSVPGDGYIRISYYIHITNAQLEEGSTATEYRPYKYIDVVSSNDLAQIATTIDLTGHAPLRKVGNVADYIDYKNKKIVRNVGKIVLDGTENWILWAYANVGATKAYYFDITNFGLVVQFTGLNTHFSVLVDSHTTLQLSDDISWTIRNNNAHTNSFLYLRINKMSVDSLKSWLAQQYANGTPVTVYFLPETSSEEQFESPTIPTLKKTCVITANDEELEASNIDAKYMSK